MAEDGMVEDGMVEDGMVENENLAEQTQYSQTKSCLYDLRQDSDLLLPTPLLRQALLLRRALDVEVIPLLTQLYASSNETEAMPTDGGRFQLRQFIQQICLAYPEVFQH